MTNHSEERKTPEILSDVDIPLDEPSQNDESE